MEDKKRMGLIDGDVYRILLKNMKEPEDIHIVKYVGDGCFDTIVDGFLYEAMPLHSVLNYWREEGTLISLQHIVTTTAKPPQQQK